MRTEILVPQEFANDDEARLVAWEVEPGNEVRAGQAVAQMESAKATFQVEAPADGLLVSDVEPSTTLETGAVLAWVTDDAVAEPPPRSSQTEVTGRITRKARKLIRQLGLDPAAFAGADEVTEADVRNHHASLRRPATAPLAPPAAAASVAGVLAPGATRAPLDSRRRKQHQVMTVANSGRPVSRLVRPLPPAATTTTGLPVSRGNLVAWCAARTLAQYPALHAFTDGEHLYSYNRVNLAVVIDFGQGMDVGVIHGAAQLSLAEFVAALRDLQMDCLRGELKPEQRRGGTFTFTDLSGAGITDFNPVLNAAQGLTLGLGAELPGTGCQNLILTFDHGLVSGVPAAAFLHDVATRVQEGATD